MHINICKYIYIHIYAHIYLYVNTYIYHARLSNILQQTTALCHTLQHATLCNTVRHSAIYVNTQVIGVDNR